MRRPDPLHETLAGNEVSGFQLHAAHLAVNKLLALVRRDEGRDFLDILEVHDQVLPLGASYWAAAGKDPGSTPLALLSLLQRRGRYRQGDFTRLSLREPVDLVKLRNTWLEASSQAEAFIRSRPPEEMGCLYYSRSRQRRTIGSLRARQGCVSPLWPPGGVLPRLSDDES